MKTEHVGVFLALSLPFILAASPAGDASPEHACAAGAATELLEKGRQVQREKGEAGAAEAVGIYRAALKEDPKCAPALWEMGWSLQIQSDFAGNLEAWDKLRALAPSYPQLDEQYENAKRRRLQAASLESMPEPGPLPAPEEMPSEGKPITFAAVGDVHMGRAWPVERAKLPPENAADLFTAVVPLLQSADVTFGNLETVLADEGESKKCGKRSKSCFAFRVPTGYGKVLKDAGFDVMSIANNHAGDFGPGGRKATMAALDAVQIHHSGPIGDLASFTHDGLRIALVAFSFGSDVYRIQELATARKLIAFLDKDHDLVLVSFHAGAEGAGAQHVTGKTELFLREDRGNPMTLARAMGDAGADLLRGHGPHLLRGMEIYKGRLIAYSLGNFSSWETFSLGGPMGVTCVLQTTLARNGVVIEARVVPVIIEKPGRPVPDPEGRAISSIRELSRADFGEALFDEKGLWRRPEPAASAP